MADDLVERVARAIQKSIEGGCDIIPAEATIAARAALRVALEEAAAYVDGKGGTVIPGASVFAPLVSRNNQPCMSGDARDRLHRRDRRAFDDATAQLADRIRALIPKEGK